MLKMLYSKLDLLNGSLKIISFNKIKLFILKIQIMNIILIKNKRIASNTYNIAKCYFRKLILVKYII